MKKQITAVIVGNGDRANEYGKFALKYPDKFKIVAIVDIDKYKLNLGKTKYNLSDEMCFDNLEDLLKKGRIADCVLNCTMDQYHYQTSMPLLMQGYHMLLEKPVTAVEEEFLKIKETAKENNCKLMVCHLLRYTPFYNGIKELIEQDKLGEIVNIESNENVGILHSSNSYIRGKWKNQKECGSPMLLSKCCHDIDLLCWLNNKTKPSRVSSFGGRNFIIPEKAPKNSGTRCLVDCPLVEKCQFSAKKNYILNDKFPQYAWQCIPKEVKDITIEEKIQSLKTNNPHGICAYKTNADIVDHQVVIMQFQNGSTATHCMTTAVPRHGRNIHIIGTRGEIEGYLDGNKFVYREFDDVSGFYKEKWFDFKEYDESNDGHFGGDIRLMKDFVAILQGEQPSIAYTSIEDSLYGHLCVYYAEKSRLTGQTQDIPDYSKKTGIL